MYSTRPTVSAYPAVFLALLLALVATLCPPSLLAGILTRCKNRFTILRASIIPAADLFWKLAAQATLAHSGNQRCPPRVNLILGTISTKKDGENGSQGADHQNIVVIERQYSASGCPKYAPPHINRILGTIRAEKDV